MGVLGIRDSVGSRRRVLYVYVERRLSGRVLDSRPRGRGVEPHQRHCVVVLEQDIFSLVLVQPRKTRPCLTERLLMGRNESNQTNYMSKWWWGPS